MTFYGNSPNYGFCPLNCKNLDPKRWYCLKYKKWIDYDIDFEPFMVDECFEELKKSENAGNKEV